MIFENINKLNSLATDIKMPTAEVVLEHPESSKLNISEIVKELSERYKQLRDGDLRSKEMLVLGWWMFGHKASVLKDYWHNQHLSFRKNWQINFPDIKLRRVEQAILLASLIRSQEKLIKLAKLGFDNMHFFVNTLRRCKKENIEKILETTSIMATIKNFDDTLEEGLHRIHCFEIFVTILENLDIAKINTELLWDTILANRSMPKNSIEKIQNILNKNENVDDYLKLLIQTGGGEPQPSVDDNIASINVTNSRLIEITKIYIDKNEVPEDFDLNRLTESMNNCSQLLSLKEAKDAAQNISIGNEAGSSTGI